MYLEKDIFEKEYLYIGVSLLIDMNMSERIRIFKALGEETRYKIVKVLLSGERCACEIPALINRTQSNTSMHLSKLLDWDIVQTRRDGKTIVYSIKDPHVRSLFKVLGSPLKQRKKPFKNSGCYK